ncbi:MAG: folate family ECF transporter S component [Clostridia bacterium]|nr:folate family ECF transporter S component [Clostridia bacterium]
MFKSVKFKFSVYDMAFCAIMLALQIVLYLIGAQTEFLKFSMEFVPQSIVATLFGIPYSLLVFTLGDILGPILAGKGWYPPLTLTSAIMGICFGFFLKDIHKMSSKTATIRILAAVFINQFVLSLFLNTFWLSKLIGKAFSVLFISRLTSSAIDFVIQVVIIFAMYKLKIPNSIEKLEKRK